MSVFGLRYLRGLFISFPIPGVWQHLCSVTMLPIDRRKEHAMKNNHKMKLTRILAAAFFALLIAALALVYAAFGEKTVSGSKTISITVVNSAAEETAYSLKTDALYLRQAMDECDGLTYTGSEGPYGIMIDSVNGERAVYSENGAYWGFSINGEYCNYGIDEQPVKDGDAFTIAYTK